MSKQFIKVSVRFKSYNSVQFDGAVYDYLTEIDDLETGDLVVVETRYGLAVAQIFEVGISSTKAKSFVVQKIDYSRIQEIHSREQRLKEIEKELEKRLKEQSRRKIFEQLAQEDDVAARLLKEMDELS